MLLYQWPLFHVIVGGPLEALGLAFYSFITRKEEAFTLSNTLRKIQRMNSGYTLFILIFVVQYSDKDASV